MAKVFWPNGLYVDDNDNVIVCCSWDNSTTVKIITAAGKKHKIIQNTKDGISNPHCVSFISCCWLSRKEESVHLQTLIIFLVTQILFFSQSFDDFPFLYHNNIRCFVPLRKPVHAIHRFFFSYVKNENFQEIIFLYFSYFCSKHRLCVHVTSASARRF